MPIGTNGWMSRRGMNFVSMCSVLCFLCCAPRPCLGSARPSVIANQTGAAVRANDWSEIEYRWKSLRIIVKTDAGLYSPVLQELGQQPTAKIGPFSPKEMSDFLRLYFVMTTAAQDDQSFSIQIDAIIRKWGLGHALPIIAAIAVENVERPFPTVFGRHFFDTFVIAQGEQMTGKVRGAGFDAKLPGTLYITVYANNKAFRVASQQAGHASARAYYDPARNEVGVALDMDAFRRLYGQLEQNERLRSLMTAAFIAFVSEAFMDDSAHELAHAYQHQDNDPAFGLPAIAEGEANVNGFTRGRDGMVFALMYNTPEAWIEGKFDSKVLEYRIKTLAGIGRPFSPFEVQRFVLLRRFRQQGKNIRVADLLGLTSRDFYSGDDAEIRYLYSWALCLAAIRSESTATLLRRAVTARLAGRAPKDDEAALDFELRDFIDDPVHLRVSKERMSRDTEKIYGVDRVFAGLFYAWIYVADPQDSQAVVYLGDAFFDSRNLSEARKYYELAHEIAPTSPYPLRRLADVWELAGRLEEAEAYRAKARDLEKTHSQK